MTKNPELSRVRPLSSAIAHQDFKTRFERKLPQVGEIKYHEEPEDEERRHLKVIFFFENGGINKFLAASK